MRKAEHSDSEGWFDKCVRTSFSWLYYGLMYTGATTVDYGPGCVHLAQKSSCQRAASCP
jgi:hypothetical protein